MNKILLLLLICFSNFIYGQKKKAPAFDLADFDQKMEVAEWLCEYDNIAWQTSDSVMNQDKKELEKLGSEWFCFKQHDTWHAVFGKFENNKFDLVFHYMVENKGVISRTYETVDTSILHRYSRALKTASSQLTAMRDSVKIRFNQYIKENEDRTLSVWILPAFQPNSVAVYGGEFIYTIDETGNKILKDDSYYQGVFRGFKVDKPRDVWMDYQELTKPSLGTIFFVWYYKSYFTKIHIDNANSTSTVIKSNDQWVWIHVDKGQDKKKKRK